MLTVYDILHAGLMAGVQDGTITPEQARLSSKWLDVTERLDELRR